MGYLAPFVRTLIGLRRLSFMTDRSVTPEDEIKPRFQSKLSSLVMTHCWQAHAMV
jgi:hypothetical protein